MSEPEVASTTVSKDAKFGSVPLTSPPDINTLSIPASAAERALEDSSSAVEMVISVTVLDTIESAVVKITDKTRSMISKACPFWEISSFFFSLNIFCLSGRDSIQT